MGPGGTEENMTNLSQGYGRIKIILGTYYYIPIGLMYSSWVIRTILRSEHILCAGLIIQHNQHSISWETVLLILTFCLNQEI